MLVVSVGELSAVTVDESPASQRLTPRLLVHTSTSGRQKLQETKKAALDFLSISCFFVASRRRCSDGTFVLGLGGSCGVVEGEGTVGGGAVHFWINNRFKLPTVICWSWRCWKGGGVLAGVSKPLSERHSGSHPSCSPSFNYSGALTACLCGIAS